MNILRRLWADQSAVITTTDLILISTILVIGMIVGLTTLRDQVVQELGDLAVAVGSLDQSYSFAGFTITINGEEFVVAGSSFADASDDCEEGDNEGDPANDVAGQAPACIDLGIAASSEG